MMAYKGQHSFNKKYERFSDVYKYSQKYRKRTRTPRAGLFASDSDGDRFYLPSRVEKFGRKRGGLWEWMWSVFPLKYVELLFSKFFARMRMIREIRASALLGYIPSKLFIGLCAITFGLYPYVWMWGNTYAFNNVGGRRINENSIKLLAVLGFVTQLLVPLSVGAWVAWRITGADVLSEAWRSIAFAYASVYLLVIFPMRCFNYFCVRWAIRAAVIDWDREGVMVGRSVPSWLKLFLLGSIYLQYHINRLMGLGMPGFADASEIELDVTLRERINGYVTTGRPDRAVVSWTKDNYVSEYDDDYDEREEEYYG
jgi:hypothetical protein